PRRPCAATASLRAAVPAGGPSPPSAPPGSGWVRRSSRARAAGSAAAPRAGSSRGADATRRRSPPLAAVLALEEREAAVLLEHRPLDPVEVADPLLPCRGVQVVDRHPLEPQRLIEDLAVADQQGGDPLQRPLGAGEP